MTDPLDPKVENVQIVSYAQQARYSRSTIAHLNETADKLRETKKSMLDDMSKGAFETPQKALDAIMTLQGVQGQIDKLKSDVAGHSSAAFVEKDIETIELMRRNGLTEQKIAEYFETNQTKINRLRNGKAPLGEA